MTEYTTAEIRLARAADPKSRERDFAKSFGITEGELVAAFCGDDSYRLDLSFDQLFSALDSLGEVMALTRNESAVHEKIGVYDRFIAGKHASMMLGENIDMRMFPNVWAHAFSVIKREEGHVRHSLQFFDKHGNAVHKIHARPNTNLNAWHKLIGQFHSQNQVPVMEIEAFVPTILPRPTAQQLSDLRDGWDKMTDTHQFFPLLNRVKVSRIQALENIGADYATVLEHDSIETMMRLAVERELPIMCFVGSLGCIQIHSGPIVNVKTMGPWLNIMDETFHLHLRTDHIASLWAVKKPTDKGHVHSIEAYDARGELIIQFFGKREEGYDERPVWREIVHSLPKSDVPRAA